MEPFSERLLNLLMALKSLTKTKRLSFSISQIRKSLNKLVGQNFLLSIAVNFKNTPRRLEIQKRFINNLSLAYPRFSEFVNKNPPNFSNYSIWMQKFTGGSIEEVEKFKSKCKRGKTCRKKRGGGRRLSKKIYF